MTRPSDAQLIALLRDAARNASSTARTASRAIPLRRAADALAAAPSLTWEERVASVVMELDGTETPADYRALRQNIDSALRKAFPEYAPERGE